MAQEQMVDGPARASRTTKHSPRTIAALLGSALLFGAGCSAGIVAGQHALNWWGACGDWDIGVTDQYDLAIARPANAVSPAAPDVDRHVTLVLGRTLGNPLDADVRLAPYLFSSMDGTEGISEANVRDSLSRRQAFHTNPDGEVSISGHWAAQGPSLSPDEFVPPSMGATFMVADGQNVAGGFTFYELLINRGRVWSIGSLIRFDCAASALYGSCIQHTLKDAVGVGAVQTLVPHLGGPSGALTADRILTGTLVQASIMLPDS